jgi:hypothetical protein
LPIAEGVSILHCRIPKFLFAPILPHLQLTVLAFHTLVYRGGEESHIFIIEIRNQ